MALMPALHFSRRIGEPLGFFLLGLGMGCTTVQVIPAAMEDQVNRELSFSQVKKDPSSFVGKLIVVGGAVLTAKALEESVRIEILQLPLNAALEPNVHLTESQGRMLAFYSTFVDPATLPPGTRITIVGEVTGSQTLPLDETTYTYPTFKVKHLTVWPRSYLYGGFQPYPFWGGYWGSYWGPYFYPYWQPHQIPLDATP
jgi:outer membrane lipoprotein